MAGAMIREKMYLNLLEDDTVERLQVGTDPETLVQEHVSEKRKVSWIEREQKKSCQESTSTMLVMEEVLGLLPNPFEVIALLDEYQFGCDDYV